MLKKRIIANVVVKDGIVVQSINFKKYLPVGKPLIALEFLNNWGIDEIILTDISASRKNEKPDFAQIRKATGRCHVPLTVGGGIKTIEDIKELMHCGADKISLNQSAIKNPILITEAAHIFGDQCIVVSVDAVKTENGYRVYDYVTGKTIDASPDDFCLKAQELGAGEILINSVDRDGSYEGFDIELINSVCNKVTVPVICCGGAKNANDFIEALTKTNASAVCAANFFHFTEHSVNTTKTNILKKTDVRLETHADYKENGFDSELRLRKKKDEVLEEMLFIKIEKEII